MSDHQESPPKPKRKLTRREALEAFEKATTIEEQVQIAHEYGSVPVKLFTNDRDDLFPLPSL